MTQIGPHPSHDVGYTDSSFADYKCKKCGATDVTGGGWGALAAPCPMEPRYMTDEEKKARFQNVPAMILPSPPEAPTDPDIVVQCEFWKQTFRWVTAMAQGKGATAGIPIRRLTEAASAMEAAAHEITRLRELPAAMRSFGSQGTCPLCGAELDEDGVAAAENSGELMAVDRKYFLFLRGLEKGLIERGEIKPTDWEVADAPTVPAALLAHAKKVKARLESLDPDGYADENEANAFELARGIIALSEGK